MICGRTILLFCLYALQRTYFAQDDRGWTAFQYEGLDDLYMQTRDAASKEPNYAIIESLCDKWISERVFDAVAKRGDGFRSRIRGQLKKLENPPPNVHQNGSRRYEWTIRGRKFVTDIYACADLRHSGHTYALSQGYEDGHLFFLFVFDWHTNVLELKAFIMENLIRLNRDNISSYLKRRDTYYKNVTKKHENDVAENPVCGLTKANKLRLCALVLSAPYYKNRYEFLASAASVDFRCKEVIVEQHKSRKKVLEHTYRCLAKTVSEPRTDAPVHISRNYTSRKVNTFTSVQEEHGVEVVKLDTGFKYIFFVDEPYDENWNLKPGAKRQTDAASDSGPSSSSAPAINEGHRSEIVEER